MDAEMQDMFTDVPTAMPEKLRELIQQYDLIKKLAEQLDNLKKTYDRKEAEMFAEMEQAGVQSIKVDGRTVFRSTRIWASIPPETKGAAYQWLIDNNYDHLIKETVNSQTLSSEMTARIEEQGIESVPEFIKISPRNSLGIRR